MENTVISEIYKGIDFTQEQLDIIKSKFEKQFIKKGETILREGQFVPYQYYVHSGCLRTYHISESGKEYTLQFAINDWWISDYTAFFTGGKSVFFIECIQDAVIYKISKESMEELYTEIPAIETFYRIKMERFFASFQRRILSDLAFSAKEKYSRFIKIYPNIEKSIKDYHLASYLGITKESLSRVRKDLVRNRILP